MTTLKNMLTNSHTWLVIASVLSGGISAYEKVASPVGVIAAILSAVLMICTMVTNQNQVAAAATSAQK